MTDKTKGRFSSIIWANKAVESIPILIVGLGGIGSWLTLFLARAGFTRIVTYDDDRVELVNIAGQLYRMKDADAFKGDALDSIIRSLSGTAISPMNMKWTSELCMADATIVISAVDNMVTRLDLFNTFLKQSKSSFISHVQDEHQITSEITPLFVDGRLLAEQLQTYFVTKDRESRYRATLFDDSEVEDVDCSNKQTTHFAAGIAYNMMKGIVNHIALCMQPACARELPFSIEDDGYLIMPKVVL